MSLRKGKRRGDELAETEDERKRRAAILRAQLASDEKLTRPQ